MMDETSPTDVEWRQLFAVMDRLKEVKPWEFMDETDLFGVQNPETGELGFVSVMGTLGEHYAVALYLGAEGLYGFWDMQHAGPFLTPDQVLNTPQLQASFEDRNTLHQKDRDVIKKLGLKYRGRNAWPHFQSFAPAMVPWGVTAVEARFLIYALEQLLEVIDELTDDITLLNADEETEYLIRVPTTENGALRWHNEKRLIPPPESRAIPVYMDRHAIEFLEKLPPTMGMVDIDFFWTPVPVMAEGARPYYPYMLIIVDASSGMILGSDTMIAEPSVDDMWGTMPMKVGQTLARLRLRPGIIRVTSDSVAQFLQPLAAHLGIKLKREDELPEMENLKGMLINFLMR